MTTNQKALLILFLLLVTFPLSGGQRDFQPKIDNSVSLQASNYYEVPELHVKLEDNSMLVMRMEPSIIIQEFSNIGEEYNRTTYITKEKISIKSFRSFDEYKIKKHVSQFEE